MYHLARLGLALLGWYTIINAFPLMISLGAPMAIAVPVNVVFVLLPGLMLVVANRCLAGAIVSTDDDGAWHVPDPRGFAVLGFALLGVWFVVQGLFNVVTGALLQIALLETFTFQAFVLRAGGPLTQVIAGVVLFIGAKSFGRTVVKDAETGSPAGGLAGGAAPSGRERPK